jgi:mRNA interferase MazF
MTGNGKMDILQYHVYLINLDPTVGHEIKKIRPCIVISPNEMNNNINTIIIAPLTTKSHKYPTRIPVTFKGKKGWIIVDQIRTIDKKRIIKEVGIISGKSVFEIKSIIKEMLVD